MELQSAANSDEPAQMAAEAAKMMRRKKRSLIFCATIKAIVIFPTVTYQSHTSSKLPKKKFSSEGIFKLPEGIPDIKH